MVVVVYFGVRGNLWANFGDYHWWPRINSSVSW